MRSIRVLVGVLGVSALLAVAITGTATASSVKTCDVQIRYVTSDLAGCDAPAPSIAVVKRYRPATYATTRAAVIRHVCELLKPHGLSNARASSSWRRFPHSSSKSRTTPARRFRSQG